MALRALAAFLVMASAGSAQSVRVYSEFQRIDPFGAVIGADRAERPREVLSPLLPRNAHSSFHVVVAAPEGQKHSVFLAQNPENAVEVSIYREIFVKHGDAWIPDGLEKLQISESGAVPDPVRQAPGQTAAVYFMDVFVKADAPVRRTRLEVQLSFEGRWIIYPMELRISAPVVPGNGTPGEALAAIDAPASDTAISPLRGYLCNGNGGAGAAGEQSLTIRSMIRRNARQDVRWARTVDAKSRPDLLGGILNALGASDLKAWCQTPAGPPKPAAGAEWYLRVRDLLYRARPLPAAAK